MSVNAYSSLGRYGHAEKLLNSSKVVYSEFTLPETFVHGDAINIPVVVYNNLAETIVVETFFEEERDGSSFKNQ